MMAWRTGYMTVTFEDSTAVVHVMDAGKALAIGKDFEDGGKTERIVMPDGKKLQRESIVSILVRTGRGTPGRNSKEADNETAVHRFLRPLSRRDCGHTY